MLHKRQRHFDAAERAYRQALSLHVQQKDRSHEAASLGELGNLYAAWNKPEQAVTFYRQAADIDAQLGDTRNEGLDRNNIAETLRTLGRHDEARPEIQRAIECFKPFGHAAQPWTAFAILHDIEQAAGNALADDPDLDFWSSAELLLLLERLEGGRQDAT